MSLVDSQKDMDRRSMVELLGATSGMKEVTSSVAARIIELTQLSKRERELIMRPISKAHVDFYATQMRKSRWSAVSMIFIASFGDRYYLINGNHTLRAIIESGVTQILPVVFMEVDDFGDIRDLYAKADRGKARTSADSLRAYEVASMLELSGSTDVNYLAAACSLIMGDMQSAPKLIADEDKIPLMTSYAPAYLSLKTAYAEGPDYVVRKLMRKDVLSVALITVAEVHNASEFWRLVATGEVSDRFHPAIRLRDWVMVSQMVGGAAQGLQVTSIEQRATATYCWNAWLRKRQIKYLRLPRSSEQLRIEGTKYSVPLQGNG